MTDNAPDRIADRLRRLGEEMAAQGRHEDSVAAYFGALAVLFDDERLRHRPSGVPAAVPVTAAHPEITIVSAGALTSLPA